MYLAEEGGIVLPKEKGSKLVATFMKSNRFQGVLSLKNKFTQYHANLWPCIRGANLLNISLPKYGTFSKSEISRRNSSGMFGLRKQVSFTQLAKRKWSKKAGGHREERRSFSQLTLQMEYEMRANFQTPIARGWREED